ncbi:MAG: MBL fold metallo-hydrolase [Chloroflexota bacterium]
MIEEILPGLHRIEIPLPRNPLKATNCYVIKASDRSLIVDTGMNREECRTALGSGLRELGVDLRNADLFITHMHADHSGLVDDLVAEGARAYCSRLDAEIIVSGVDWDGMLARAASNGFPPEELRQVVEKHPGARYRAGGAVDFTLVGEGDQLTVGEYSFRCVETPGHTVGHLCLYEPNKRILVAGDHVLGDITPNITGWSGQERALARFLSSLDKVYRLDVDLVLPGHRRVFSDCKGRIRELQEHHRLRAEEAVAALEAGPRDAYQVAASMSWDLTYESFDRFPVAQKWFAAGEALAHLQYLYHEGRVQRETRDQRTVFLTPATPSGSLPR